MGSTDAGGCTLLTDFPNVVGKTCAAVSALQLLSSNAGSYFSTFCVLLSDRCNCHPPQSLQGFQGVAFGRPPSETRQARGTEGRKLASMDFSQKNYT